MGILDKIVSGAKNTSNKISEEVDVHGLNSKISDEKKIIEKTYHDMGEYYYSHRKDWKGSDLKQINEYCTKIDRCLVRISELEKEIQDTKDKAKEVREANRMESS